VGLALTAPKQALTSFAASSTAKIVTCHTNHVTTVTAAKANTPSSATCAGPVLASCYGQEKPEKGVTLISNAARQGVHLRAIFCYSQDAVCVGGIFTTDFHYSLAQHLRALASYVRQNCKCTCRLPHVIPQSTHPNVPSFSLLRCFIVPPIDQKIICARLQIACAAASRIVESSCDCPAQQHLRALWIHPSCKDASTS